jgi:hypothetical protein
MISKAMKSRSKAIQNAIAKYNEAAGRMNPPRRPLDWQRIADYNLVEEFELLRDAREDIRSARWSSEEVRETMKLHQKVKRADEEIQRLNVEMRRLYTSIIDEHTLFTRVEAMLESEHRIGVLGALREFSGRRRRINRVLLAQLQEITRLKGYSGDKRLRGFKKGSKGKGSEDDADISSHEDNLDEDESDDEEEVAQVGGVIDFIADLATS